MINTKLFTTSEALVSRDLNVNTIDRSGCESCFLYNGSYVEVKSSDRVDEQGSPLFDIRRFASSRPSDICIFSVKKGDWDFYILRTSVLDSCFDSQSVVGLPVIAPLALHVKFGRIKQAVDLAVGIA